MKPICTALTERNGKTTVCEKEATQAICYSRNMKIWRCDEHFKNGRKEDTEC